MEEPGFDVVAAALTTDLGEEEIGVHPVTSLILSISIGEISPAVRSLLVCSHGAGLLEVAPCDVTCPGSALAVADRPRQLQGRRRRSVESPLRFAGGQQRL